MQALLTRALAKARDGHAALEHIQVRGPEEPPFFDGLEDAALAHGAGAVIAGIEATLAALIDLLARLIGEDMAVDIVSQVTTHPADAAPQMPGTEASS